MKRLQRAAIIVSLVEKLKDDGSWCGETNIQKAMYFLKEMMHIPLDFEFILYRHGPYSFDLKEELTALRADSILELKSSNPEYGPRYIPGSMRDYVLNCFPKTIKRYSKKIEFVSSHLGEKGVVDLERLATALYVNVEKPEQGQENRAKRITEFKPHIAFMDSLEAVKQVDQMANEAGKLSVD